MYTNARLVPKSPDTDSAECTCVCVRVCPFLRKRRQNERRKRSEIYECVPRYAGATGAIWVARLWKDHPLCASVRGIYLSCESARQSQSFLLLLFFILRRRTGTTLFIPRNVVVVVHLRPPVQQDGDCARMHGFTKKQKTRTATTERTLKAE